MGWGEGNKEEKLNCSIQEDDSFQIQKQIFITNMDKLKSLFALGLNPTA